MEWMREVREWMSNGPRLISILLTGGVMTSGMFWIFPNLRFWNNFRVKMKIQHSKNKRLQNSQNVNSSSSSNHSTMEQQVRDQGSSQTKFSYGQIVKNLESQSIMDQISALSSLAILSQHHNSHTLFTPTIIARFFAIFHSYTDFETNETELLESEKSMRTMVINMINTTLQNVCASTEAMKVEILLDKYPYLAMLISFTLVDGNKKNKQKLQKGLVDRTSILPLAFNLLINLTYETAGEDKFRNSMNGLQSLLQFIRDEELTDQEDQEEEIQRIGGRDEERLLFDSVNLLKGLIAINIANREAALVYGVLEVVVRKVRYEIERKEAGKKVNQDIVIKLIWCFEFLLNSIDNDEETKAIENLLKEVIRTWSGSIPIIERASVVLSKIARSSVEEKTIQIEDNLD